MCAREIPAEFVAGERSLPAVTTAEAPHLPLLSCGASVRKPGSILTLKERPSEWHKGGAAGERSLLLFPVGP